jgi:predicted phosphodiesterase
MEQSMGSSSALTLLRARLALSALPGVLLLIGSIGVGSLEVHAQSAPVIWTELVGPGAKASIRAIVPANGPCPLVTADDNPRPMQPRTFPDEKPNPTSLVQICEYVAPAETVSVTLEGKALPLPRTNPQRIVVFGDTGCRIKKQDCANDWDYPDIAKSAAEAHPDLVVHLGDYVYRRGCDATQTDCRQWSITTGWEAWEKDFFQPSQPLFDAAPWIMVRGNHETCDRNGDGWFRFLDHSSPATYCNSISLPFAIDLGGLGFAILDSAESAQEDESPHLSTVQKDDFATTLDDFYSKVKRALPSETWILTHEPFYAVNHSGTLVSNKTLQRRIEAQLTQNIKLIASGHVHMFEAINFGDSTLPPQLILGMGGTKTESKPTLPIDVQNAVIIPHTGYMVWDRDGQNWNGQLHEKGAKPIANCQLIDRQLTCAAVR